MRPTASSKEIIEAMKHPVSGLGFLMSQPNLPPLTFVSADAVSWLMVHMEGVQSMDKAVQVSNNVVEV